MDRRSINDMYAWHEKKRESLAAKQREKEEDVEKEYSSYTFTPRKFTNLKRPKSADTNTQVHNRLYQMALHKAKKDEDVHQQELIKSVKSAKPKINSSYKLKSVPSENYDVSYRLYQDALLQQNRHIRDIESHQTKKVDENGQPLFTPQSNAVSSALCKGKNEVNGSPTKIEDILISHGELYREKIKLKQVYRCSH